MRARMTALALALTLTGMLFAPVSGDAQRRRRGGDDDGGRRGRGMLTQRVTGTATKQDGTQVPFRGRFTIQRFADQDGKLVAIGQLTGVIGGGGGERDDDGDDNDENDDNGDSARIRSSQFGHSFLPAGYRVSAQSQRVNQQVALPAQVTNATCQVLNLTLGPLDLDLLGLRVQLNQINLDITAESGRGKLLGNLLCGVANLLNPLDLSGLINLLNRILGALG